MKKGTKLHLAVLAAVCLVLLLQGALGLHHKRPRPLVSETDIRHLYEPFDWSQPGLVPEPTSPAQVVADFLTCLAEERWGDAVQLVSPHLRDAIDADYLQTQFGPLTTHLSKRQILDQVLRQDAAMIEVAVADDGGHAMLWAASTVWIQGKWYIDHQLAPIHAVRLSGDWSTCTTEHYSVNYKGDAQTAETAAALMEEQHRSFAESFGVAPKHTAVYFVPDRNDVPALAGSGASRRVLGFTRQNTIVVPAPESSPASGPNTFRNVITHEIAHTFIQELAQGTTVPQWLNEGLASYMAHATPPNLDEALRYVRGRSFTMTELFSSPTTEHYAYQLSWAAVQHIELEFGPGAALELVRELGRGSSWAGAVKQVTGLDATTFDELIRGHLQGST